MIENIILLIIAAASILFTGLLWLRQNLLHELREAQSREAILQRDFEKRRDTVPYLLESARTGSESTDTWRKLAEDRAEFMTPKNYQKELEFEQTLQRYLASTNVRSVNFLEAKKNIEAISTLIEEQKRDRQAAMNRFNERRKQFPYSVASAIFGFHAL
ncbi:MAG: LemA family protein [Patescibacteria group bacterium]